MSRLTCHVGRRAGRRAGVWTRDFRVCRRVTRRVPNRARARVGVFCTSMLISNGRHVGSFVSAVCPRGCA